jgi:hypothetical protein
MDVRDTVLECVDCTHLAQDSEHWRVPVNTVVKLLVP